MDKTIANKYNFYRNNAFLITKIRKTIDYFRKQFYRHATIMVSEITPEFESLSKYPEYLDLNLFQNYIVRIINSLENEDYISCSDNLCGFIHEILIPLQQAVFTDVQENLSDIYASYENSAHHAIEFEETECGYPTLLYHSKSDIYLCSTNDPLYEAFFLADEIFSPEVNSYHIWGIGLGYHIYELNEITKGATDIYVYDNDLFLLEIAKANQLGKWQEVFGSSKIHLVFDPDITRFSAALSQEKAKFAIHMPSLYKLPENNEGDIERKKILKKIQITLNTFSESKNDIYINFYKNIKNANHYAEDLFPQFQGQNVAIIAAGPSLDKNIDELKQALSNHVPIKIIAVCTVLKKLIGYGITPDAICTVDASEKTYTQISGLEYLNIPLILSTAAYYEFAQNYSGDKYLACQKDFEPSEKLGHTLFNTGGSVTTLALDFAIQAAAKKIVMIGCDLAYTDNQTHAVNTAAHRAIGNNESIITVNGFYGTPIKSGLMLSMYREWIENRIRHVDANPIKFINSSEGGAYIQGMKHLPLKQALEKLE